MKAPDESGTNEDFPKNTTEWIAAAGKRCTDVHHADRFFGALM